MKKRFFNFCSLSALVFGILFQFTGIGNIPDILNLSYNQTSDFELGGVLGITPQSESVIKISDESGDKSNIEIIPQQVGSTNIDVDLFGIKVKTVKVNVHGPKEVIVGGQSVGVAIYTKGALVIGTSNIRDETGNTSNPAKDAGLQSGDIIEKVNGVEANNADHVMDLINSDITTGKTISLGIVRGGERLEVNVAPVKDKVDGKYRMGLWVRDSMAGVGTMSFYDPVTMKYACLGHAVYDGDTNTLLNLKSGEIVSSDIYGIKQGEEGNPGELQGSFNSDDRKIGSIDANNDFGIYGKLYIEPERNQYNKVMDSAIIDEIKVGPAKILTTLDDDGVKEYDVYIEKLASQKYPSTKSMVIKVTDKELLSKTGGIVQGMSGSPIIQNDKVVGAVTHVFVSDPTKGYGLYAQWMLEQME